MDLRRLLALVFLSGLSCSGGQIARCPRGQWQCDDGNCILHDWRCDGEGDCLDGSDEMDCTSPDCPPGQFPCLDSVGCVNVSARCDGQRQCPTGSDEENCTPNEGCLDSDWTCLNRICIPTELRCNGENDCLDNSDEQGCGRCTEDGFRCPEGMCLSAEERCDGKIHCSDGSDEPVTCGRRCSEQNGGCSHVCVDEAWGAMCDCPTGYKLSANGAVCEDLDECSRPFAPCLHYCTNTVGSYYCHCRDGFTLNGSTTCLARGNATRLLTLRKGSVGLLDLNSQQFKVIQTPSSVPVALTYDIGRGWFYWADSQGSIYKSDGQRSGTVYAGEPGIKGLACDWLNGHLYWTNQKTEAIYMGVDGTSCTLLSKNISPLELVLLPVESSMFWINAGPGDRVTLEKAWMDGSGSGSLAVLTAQAPCGLTVDVAAGRLYWISSFKKTVETVKVDGSGRYSFNGFFGSKPALGLAAFGSWFYWVDDRGLWRAPQNQPDQRKLLQKAAPPILSVHHELQQPRGSSACLKTSCHFCLLTKGNAAGFTCACPSSKVFLPDGACEYPRFAYATSTTINLLEFKGSETIKTLVFTADAILSFDLDWYRDWLYWVNKSGQVQRTSLTQVQTETVPTLVPVCLIQVHQRTGSLYWMSCDRFCIGATPANRGYPRQLYHAKKEMKKILLDWRRDRILWLEEERILSMNLLGGGTEEVLKLRGGVRGNVALDLRANSLLWNSERAGLTTLSLLQQRTHLAGRRWNISGSVVAAYEPFLLSLSDDVMTLWDRRDGSPIQDVTVGNDAFGVTTALKDISPVPGAPVCKEPLVQCPGSSLCLSQTQLCDGRKDCPDGFDEDHCVTTCPHKGDFRCKDRRSCVARSLVCDGRSHCRDGSDELGCPTVAPPPSQAVVLKCRRGSKPCDDGSECVLYSHVCDGERDCPDGSDERGCDAPEQTTTPAPDARSSPQTPPATEPPTQPACRTPSVLCPRSSAHICITPNQLCDGRRDCPDGFDELNCVKRCPSRSDFRCKDRRSCVSRSLVCDGRSHCHDGSDEVGCPTIDSPRAQTGTLKCRVGSKLCRDGKECVLFSHMCDGEKDCQDGSDEEECEAPETTVQITPAVNIHSSTASPSPVQPVTQPHTEPSCSSPSVLCPGSSLCISQTQICDGKRDCPDGSDEKCVKRCPYRTDFRCKDRRSCVAKSLVCDGRSHCYDGSDEFDCPAIASSPRAQTNALKCRRGSKLCKDGSECVLYSHVCDGERDCQDGSDEEGCEAPETTVQITPAVNIHSSNASPSPVQPVTQPHTEPSCSSPSVLCPGSSLCISQTQICDGKRDCPDGSDEKCVKRCPYTTDFRCKDRRSCVSRSLVCDGRSHCYDGSDEFDCPTVASPTAQTNVLKCRRGSKPCDDGSECVLFTHVCDGERDCQDGSDEQGCQKTCRQDEFQCSHGKKCIPLAQVCDGKAQCQDQSDELECWEPTETCHHRCDDGKRCVPRKFLCDGEKDCQDGTDERGCDPGSPDPGAAGVTEPPVLPAASACITPSVLCPGSSLCVSQSQLCDGRRDCPDGFDEDDCLVQCKNPADFLCGDMRKCIPRAEVCDGRAHCPDGSDERRCDSAAPSSSGGVASGSSRSDPLKCRKGFKPCRDGRECVSYTHVCDGEEDCQDGSDEQGCTVQCKAGEFQCSHGKRCIPQVQVCDGQPQCQDRSDEMDCVKLSDGCDYHCDNNSRCIPKTFLCDGERDCVDGSDEEKCGLVSCAVGQYRCASGQCLSEALRCDGYADCYDRSDEVNCARPPRCPAQLRCPHNHQCLQKEWICDGEDDCKDGSDEKNCTRPPVTCREYQWKCGGDNQCIPRSWRCDGKKDCHSGVDEDGCNQPKCPPQFYQCGSGECVDPALACNRITNCADSSDEGPGCVQHNCSSPSAPQCDHHCANTPHGPRCYCAAGFRHQSSSLSCVDIDECNATQHAACKHICLNTRGSYVCHCHPGFFLEPDNRSCKIKDEPVLLASVQSELLLLGIHSATLRLLSSASRPVFSLDYHWAQHKVYWLSPDYQSIRWSDYNDLHKKGTLVKGVKSDFVAVDWVGKNLYWVDGLVGQILVVQLGNAMVKPQNYTVVLGEGLEQPSSLVLLPHIGLMLWSEIGSVPQIERSGMDGSERKVVVSHGLSWPVSLTFDLLDNRIYWADEKLRCIGSASLDGDDVKILQLAETPSPFSVAVFNDRIFWSDTKRRTIRSADKNTGKDQKVLLKRPGQPFGLKVMHPLSQPDISSPCDQLHCSHVCLLAPKSRSRSGAPTVQGPTAVCRCPVGQRLSKDRITCSPPTQSAFILLLSPTSMRQIYLHAMHDGVGLKKLPTSRVLALPGVSSASGLDAAIRGSITLYVADAGQGSVELLTLSVSVSRQVLTPAGHFLKLKDDSVTALAVDWVTFNLYWSSARLPDLHVTSPRDDFTTTSLLQGSLTGTTSIALHPPSGRLCYTAVATVGGRSQSQVECSYMDGRNRAVLWRKSTAPDSLVFYNEGTVIYWAERAEGVIISIGVDGSGYKQFKAGPGPLVSFTYADNMLLWVTLDKDTTRLWFSDGIQPKQLWFEAKTNIVSVKAFSQDSQTGTNSCSNNNGGCPHLCLAYPGGRTCKCGRGFQTVNATSCARCPADYTSCSDGSECVDSSRFCDSHVDCWDQSDEQNCLYTNSASSGTISKDGRPGQTSSSSHPTDQKKSGLSVQKDSKSCDQQLCNDHGRCVMDGKATRCECATGYKGESCQETDARGNHAAVILGVIFVVAALVTAVAIFLKRRTWASSRTRAIEKETLMTSMSSPLPCELYDSDSEDLDSPVDVRNPPTDLKPTTAQIDSTANRPSSPNRSSYHPIDPHITQ